ncbi:hypothetical protein ABFS82_07G081400 [Erythranthe guttata]
MKLRLYEMALNTWSDWLEININRTKTKSFFTSLSPGHFHLWWRRRHHQPMVEATAEDHGRHGRRHEFLRHGVQFREHFLQIPHLPLEPLSSIIAAPVNFHLLHVLTAVVAAAAVNCVFQLMMVVAVGYFLLGQVFRLICPENTCPFRIYFERNPHL